MYEKWKKLLLWQAQNLAEEGSGERPEEDDGGKPVLRTAQIMSGEDFGRKSEAKESGRVSLRQAQIMPGEDFGRESADNTGSSYLVACEDTRREEFEKQLLYEVLGPVFFGRRKAATREELIALFREQYGIDVRQDFCEGDEHYEEYLEAQQAIAEGMSIYSGSIPFDDTALADLAGRLWADSEQKDRRRFRRINTMLEE